MEPNLKKSRSPQDSSIFHCGICSDIATLPQQCFACGSLYCQACIRLPILQGKVCKEGCDTSEIKDISAGLRRIYSQIDIRCRYYQKCKRTLKINELEKHEDVCQASPCKMKEICNNNLVRNKKYDQTFCSQECYVLDLVKSTDDMALLYQSLNKLIVHGDGGNVLEWDECNKASFLKVFGNRITAQNVPVSAFFSAVTKTGFSSGEHYWELQDFAQQSLLKVGVTLTTKIDYSAGFSDIPTGYAYYALGQLRNGSDSKGNTYGVKHTPGTPLGVYLNMNKGELGFVINGKYQGSAFTSESLTHGTIYPAVSFLKSIDCTITKKKVPETVRQSM